MTHNKFPGNIKWWCHSIVNSNNTHILTILFLLCVIRLQKSVPGMFKQGLIGVWLSRQWRFLIWSRGWTWFSTQSSQNSSSRVLFRELSGSFAWTPFGNERSPNTRTLTAGSMAKFLVSARRFLHTDSRNINGSTRSWLHMLACCCLHSPTWENSGWLDTFNIII